MSSLSFSVVIFPTAPLFLHSLFLHSLIPSSSSTSLLPLPPLPHSFLFLHSLTLSSSPPLFLTPSSPLSFPFSSFPLSLLPFPLRFYPAGGWSLCICSPFSVHENSTKHTWRKNVQGSRHGMCACGALYCTAELNS